MRYCINCKKEISKRCKRCRKCFIKWLNKYHKGKNHWNWQNNKTHGTRCKCGNLMSSNADMCRECFKKSMKGKNNINYGAYKEKNTNWRGGKSFEPYSPNFDKFLKERVRDRDSYRCQICNIEQSELSGKHKTLHIHHIDYDKNNNALRNLISLCYKCHLRTNGKREYWIKYFLEERK